MGDEEWSGPRVKTRVVTIFVITLRLGKERKSFPTPPKVARMTIPKCPEKHALSLETKHKRNLHT